MGEISSPLILCKHFTISNFVQLKNQMTKNLCLKHSLAKIISLIMKLKYEYYHAYASYGQQ